MALTPTEQIIYNLIKKIQRDTGTTVRTLALGVHMSKDPRIVRYTLVRLEAKGIVQRKGQRGGWFIPTPALIPVTPKPVALPIVPTRPLPKRQPAYNWRSLPA